MRTPLNMIGFAKRKKQSLLPFLIHWLFWGSYFTLLWSRQLVLRQDGLWAGGAATWGDGAAHLAYMSAFAFRQKFPINHPLFWGGRFSYPFVADMLGGWLVKLGFSLTTAYVLWGLVLSLVLVGLIYKLLVTWFKSGWAALVGSGIFFWSGGLGCWWWVKDVWDSGLINTLMMLPREYTHMEEKGIYWINTISAEFLPQRAFLLGMSVGILILLWLAQTKEKNGRKASLRFLGAGLVAGMLPVIHAHTLIVVAVVSIWWFIEELVREKKIGVVKKWVWFGVPAMGLGGVLTLVFILPTISGSFIKFWPGWLTNLKDGGGNFIWFWLKNWGAFWILAIGGFMRLVKEAKMRVAPFIFLWGLGNLILFQPWAWDNSKIFTWVYLIFSGAAGVFLIELWQKKFWAWKLLVVFLFSISIGAGFLDNIRLLQIKNTALRLFSREDLVMAEQVRQETDAEAIFLTGDYHNHWVPVLTGRQILMGYQGWLWSYGINYYERERDIRAMYQGGKRATVLFDSYGVDYVVIEPQAKKRFGANEEFYASQYPVAFENEKTRVYRIGN